MLNGTFLDFIELAKNTPVTMYARVVVNVTTVPKDEDSSTYDIDITSIALVSQIGNSIVSTTNVSNDEGLKNMLVDMIHKDITQSEYKIINDVSRQVYEQSCKRAEKFDNLPLSTEAIEWVKVSTTN